MARPNRQWLQGAIYHVFSRGSNHVFENRFGVTLQETEEQFLWTLRYVVRNPVEAGLCASPFDARWTSFAATAGLAPAPPYLCVDEILELFGGTREQARRRYVDFVVGESIAAAGPGKSPGVPAVATDIGVSD